MSVGQHDQILVLLQIFQPITKKSKAAGQQCQAALSLIDLFAERQKFHCAEACFKEPECWNARSPH